MADSREDPINVSFTPANDLIITYRRNQVRLTPAQAKKLHDVIEVKYGVPGVIH